MNAYSYHVKTRAYGGTYIATCNGCRSSCTSNLRYAARSAAAKAFAKTLDTQQISFLGWGVEFQGWTSEVKEFPGGLFEITYQKKS